MFQTDIMFWKEGVLIGIGSRMRNQKIWLCLEILCYRYVVAAVRVHLGNQ